MRERLDEYEGYHQTFGNEVCHYLGIPSIVAGAATLLGLVPLATFGSFTLTLSSRAGRCSSPGTPRSSTARRRFCETCCTCSSGPPGSSSAP
jgi:hypothetical protein